MALDDLVHQWLRETGFVAFIMAKAAVAPHVDDDVAVECLAEFNRNFTGEGHRFGIITIDVEYWRLNALCNVGWIRRRPRILRAGCETNLVVHDKVQATAGIIPTNAGKAEALPNDALTSKGRVTMQKHGQHLFMLAKVVACGLVRAYLTEYYWIHRFKVRGVWHKAHMHLDAVKFAVGAGAEVIFHIARTANIVRVRASTGKFVEDDAVWLCHHIG